MTIVTDYEQWCLTCTVLHTANNHGLEFRCTNNGIREKGSSYKTIYTCTNGNTTSLQFRIVREEAKHMLGEMRFMGNMLQINAF